MLVRIDLGGHTAQRATPGAWWVDAPRFMSWLWDDHGEEVTEAEASLIAAGWGITLPAPPASAPNDPPRAHPVDAGEGPTTLVCALGTRCAELDGQIDNAGDGLVDTSTVFVCCIWKTAASFTRAPSLGRPRR